MKGKEFIAAINDEVKRRSPDGLTEVLAYSLDLVRQAVKGAGPFADFPQKDVGKIVDDIFAPPSASETLGRTVHAERKGVLPVEEYIKRLEALVYSQYPTKVLPSSVSKVLRERVQALRQALKDGARVQLTESDLSLDPVCIELKRGHVSQMLLGIIPDKHVTLRPGQARCGKRGPGEWSNADF